jgi:hypothetical protein
MTAEQLNSLRLAAVGLARAADDLGVAARRLAVAVQAVDAAAGHVREVVGIPATWDGADEDLLRAVLVHVVERGGCGD